MSDGFVRPHLTRMAGYQPGEQPQGGSFIKLNTNENPYPPSPRALSAIIDAAGERLRLYPDPVGTKFRQAAARLHGVEPSMILVGNGSDDLLTILIRAFVSPGDAVVYPTPSYILYKTLVELQDGQPVSVPFDAEWRLDPGSFAVPGARLTFLANPNSPSGTNLSPREVAALARRLGGPLVVDEAYANFAESDCIGLVAEHPNVIVTRSLSKGYSLAGLRLGYLIARPEIVNELMKVKDSYNCDALSLAGGAAALDDQEYLARTRAQVLKTRARLTGELRALGYEIPESHANFVWCQGGPPASKVYEALKERGILVRLMRYPDREDGLRVTVGTDEEIDVFLRVIKQVLSSPTIRADQP